MDTKSWYLSKTVWGVVVMLVGLVVPQLAGQQEATVDDIVKIASAGAEIVGASLAIYGRFKAEKKIA